MGTNFYARRIPTKKEKEMLIDAIDVDSVNEIKDLIDKLYSPLDFHTGEGAIYHLGKRSCGWTFLWNPNVLEISDGKYENGQYIPKWKYEYTYPLTRKGISDFCHRDDIVIYDEYNEEISADEFLEMAFNWNAEDGLTHKKSYKNDPHGYIFHDDKRIIEKWKSLGFEPEYSEFFSDGLRFATYQEFC